METLAYILSGASTIICAFIMAKSYSLKWTILATFWNTAWYFLFLYVFEWYAFIAWSLSISAMLYSGSYLYLKFYHPELLKEWREMNEAIINLKNQ